MPEAGLLQGCEWGSQAGSQGLTAPWVLPTQHTEPWLKSDKSHECKRAAQSIFLLLKYVVDYVKLAVSDLRAQWPQEPGRWAPCERQSSEMLRPPACALDSPPSLPPGSCSFIHKPRAKHAPAAGHRLPGGSQPWAGGHSSNRVAWG